MPGERTKSAQRATRFRLQNPPEELERVVQGLERETRRISFLPHAKAVRGCIRQWCKGVTHGWADEMVRFLRNIGVLLVETRTGRFYFDTIRADAVLRHLKSREPVPPADPQEQRLNAIKQAQAERHQGKDMSDSTLPQLPPVPAALRPSTELSAEHNPPPVHPVDEVNIIVTFPGVVAAWQTLNDALVMLKADFGWPQDTRRFTTDILLQISTALTPHATNAPSGPSHWRRIGVLRQIGTPRHRVMVSELCDVTCVVREGSIPAPSLRPDDLRAALMTALPSAETIAQAIRDIRLEKLPLVTEQPHGETEEGEPVVAKAEVEATFTDLSLEELDRRERELQENIEVLTQKQQRIAQERERRKKEEEHANLVSQIAALEHSRDEHAACAVEKARLAEAARTTAAEYDAAAQQARESAEECAASLVALRARLEQLH